jgi:hypothetical protein
MHELTFEVTRHVRTNVPSKQLTKLQGMEPPL